LINNDFWFRGLVSEKRGLRKSNEESSIRVRGMMVSEEKQRETKYALSERACK
jgi:hypothetical protein